MSVRRLLKLIGAGIIIGTTAGGIKTLSQCTVGDENNSPMENMKSVFGRENFVLPLVSAALTGDVRVPSSPIKPWDWNWDSRHSLSNTLTDGSKSKTSASGDASSKYTRHLLFIRHGQYHYADDDANCHLTELGREQLDYTGMRLKQLNFNFTKLYYSTMTRAIESTNVIIKHLSSVPAQPSSELCEGAPFQLEPPLPYYKPSIDDLRADGSRIESAFRAFVHRADAEQTSDSYEIFVCHANVIRYFVCRALQLQPEAWIRFSLDHGSITWIAVRPDGRVTLRWLGNSGHMPPDKISVQ